MPTMPTSPGQPREVPLLEEWIRRAGLPVRRLATGITDLIRWADPSDTRVLPESTIRNMLKGQPAALAPAWRLAFIAVTCDGTAEELRQIGRDDAAEELERVREALERAHSRGDEGLTVQEVQLPDDARLLVPVPPGLTPAERDLVRMAAARFAESVLEQRVEEPSSQISDSV